MLFFYAIIFVGQCLITEEKIMIKYYCKNCKIDVETSTCPICENKTVAISQIYWCFDCNIPLIDIEECQHSNHKIKRISGDIRPVYPEERLLIELLLHKPLKYLNSSCWCISGGTYFFDGEKIRIKIKELINLTDQEINLLRIEYKKYSIENNYLSFNKYTKYFVEKNRNRYNYITNEAIEYILSKTLNYQFDSTFVSFSGGKDSTVTSDLVQRALGTPKIIHIFGDTTLEFPETYDYISRFRKDHRQTPMISSRNREKNFYDLCETIGPPSRLMRWCCTVFKTGAITKKINVLFKDKTRVLTFYGIRRAESISRSKYDRESDSPKIAKQHILSPIIDWFDSDVWLYILTRQIDINDAYRLGFARVGCWCCPNNSEWSEFLSKIYHEDDFNNFRDILIRNAIKIGKPDPETYVDSGLWKAKQGGNGIDYGGKGVLTFEECATEENTFNFELQKSITPDLYELFKPFGKLNFDLGNQRLGEVFVLDQNNNVLLKLQGRIGQNKLKVSILKLPLAKAKNFKDAEGKVKCQLTKYQMCLNCSACVSACRFGAIHIKEIDGKIDYKISEDKCVHCYECINHYVSGCYLKKVLASKQ